MPIRPNPYGNFNFTVQLNDGSDDSPIVGGFSDVSGLGSEMKFSEYRNGSDKENHVRKIANINSTDDVTLKRGVIGDLRLFAWLKSTREGDIDPQPRTVVITLRDEKGDPACSWVLTAAQPKKWVGPTLAGKGGGEVAMEELHLVAERIDFNTA
jgi:phage tail-like protein